MRTTGDADGSISSFGNEGKILKIGWFSTGRGEGSYGLLKSALDAVDSGDLPAEFAFVFVNRARGQTSRTDRFLGLVESHAIPLVTLSSRDFRRSHGDKPWPDLREDFDRAAIELLHPYSADIAVQAGYMLIAPLLCSEYLTLNIHPALPGGTIGMWQQAVWDVITEGLDETGAMVHVSTEKVDEGPVLATTRFSVRGDGFDSLWADIAGSDVRALKNERGEDLALFKAIRNAGLLRERPLLVETLKGVAAGRIDPTGAGDVTDLTPVVERLAAG
ncbi:MAG: formyltransferase family protein [Chloroflexi bacterium]|nr:formyltransferase family protein [Chloroflexota bacterium]